MIQRIFKIDVFFHIDIISQNRLKSTLMSKLNQNQNIEENRQSKTKVDININKKQ